ncbi:hypothetical protein GmarT_14210 [Gimesia maris]|uniref:Uncharacterized protein n=1 Tax=Gimesia maris TaxID=122 RepID=A0ABX5YIZ0_9PLAN|nr:hypothetical protein GmarT_14210 [Gimesia maris]
MPEKSVACAEMTLIVYVSFQHWLRITEPISFSVK